MCGRFALFTDITSITKYANFIAGDYEWQPHYNISPGMTVPLLINEDEEGMISFAKWGFHPPFAGKSSSHNIINARAETIATKRTFKSAFNSDRCLIPANGFYEWRFSDKRPFYIASKSGDLLFFAGLLSRNKLETESAQEENTFVIITTEADDTIRPVHHRMPAMIPPESLQEYLFSKDINRVNKLLTPTTKAGTQLVPVTKKVNNARNNSAQLISRYEDEQSDIF